MTTVADGRRPRHTDAATRLVLLGTGGGAYPKARRCGSANAVVVGDAVYLIDAGEGVHRQLWRAGLTVNQRFAPDRPLLRAIFVTHLHADHIMDLANLVQGSWPSQPIEVFGPAPAGLPVPAFPGGSVAQVSFPEDPTPGIHGTVEYLWRAFAYNINLRVADEGRANVTDSLRVHEIGVRRDGLLAGHRPRPDGRRKLAERRRTGHGSRRDLPRGRPRRPRDGDSRAARPGVPGLRVPRRHAAGFRGLLRRHRAMRQRRPVGRWRRPARSRGDRRRPPRGPARRPAQFGRRAQSPALGALVARTGRRDRHVGRGSRRSCSPTSSRATAIPTDEEWEARVRPFFDGEVVCGVDLDEFALGGRAPIARQ